MNIYPKVGIDNIQLGMNRRQVTDILGEPLEINTEKGDVEWVYTQNLELSFQREDLYLLGVITIGCKSARLYSKRIIGCNEGELTNIFPFLSLEDDFEEFGKDYVSQEKELSVWVTDGNVTNVSIFPEYDSTGEIPIWPKLSTVQI
ncbi:outer membrane protein assembly factor BamE [Colwellia sp. MB3u-55]|jgi:hypothetical protein|uniref:outer membrane protein assembly factor BamE domain-containing protein n=1 Tax=Colwellia sp. MB3u-55 TaxID=2759810 RepID=UPI0015F40D18|nr:outer membrane protein assembly factor BamE [Colwellia sp. MB3u-55]MBA6250988.1 outer membrane protein assembly factor BamE [Colwellia sp. MB3u-55]